MAVVFCVSFLLKKKVKLINEGCKGISYINKDLHFNGIFPKEMGLNMYVLYQTIHV